MNKTLIILGLLVFMKLGATSQLDQAIKGIPIIGWNGIPFRESNSDRFKEQKESGITYNFTFYSNSDEVEKALDVAKLNDIKIIISCPELRETPEKIVQRFMKHPALGGYFLQDEPESSVFSVLADCVKRIQVLDNKHFCYINIFPNYATSKQLGTDTYREYVNLFVKEVPTPFVSFDHYPIISDGLGNRTIRLQWYENLEIISDEAKKVDKPFWAFALTTAHGGCPIPTLAEIKLQVFSNLSYGAQGIQYFTYWTPSTSVNFHNGPIDNITKAKTEVYYYVKAVNQEISNLSKVFYNSEVISVKHMGNIIPSGTKKLEVLPKNFKLLDTNGKNVIISQLQNGNNMYLVLVNKDFENKIDVTVQLNSSSLKRILNNGSSVSLRKGRSVVTVDPGDVLIYTWKK